MPVPTSEKNKNKSGVYFAVNLRKPVFHYTKSRNTGEANTNLLKRTDDSHYKITALERELEKIYKNFKFCFMKFIVKSIKQPILSYQY